MKFSHFLLQLGGVLLIAGANAEVAAEGTPSVFVRDGNLISERMSMHDTERFLGWRVSPEEAWDCSLSDPEDCGTATFSVRAGLKSKNRASWYAATLPISDSVAVPGAFRFGGWIRIDNGSDYYRDHMAAIQLTSSHGFSSRLRSYCQDGKWSYFEGRVHIPVDAGALSLQLVACHRTYKDALVSFTGLYLIPDNVASPAWQGGEITAEPVTDWRRNDRKFRIAGTVSDPSGNQPLWADFDFPRLMLASGCREPVDPSSISVLAILPDGNERTVPVAFGHSRASLEDRYLRNGTLRWRTMEGAPQYEIYFNAAGAEGPRPLCTGWLGIGELLRYPSGQQSLLWTGWPGQDLDVRDVDGDGDLDIYADNTDAGIWLCRNIGSNEQPLFLPRQKPLQSDALPEMPPGMIQLDWDRDGVADFIVHKRRPLGKGRYIDGVSVSLQAGLSGKRGAYVDVVNLKDEPIVFGNATWVSMRPGDFDGDGLEDIAVGSADSDLHLLLNRGMRHGKPAVERIVVSWNLYDDPNDSGDMSLKPCPVDWNGDGRDDIVLAGWSGLVQLLINRNLKDRAVFENAVPLMEVSGIVNVIESPMPDAADWDGDGDLDLICGNVNGYFMLLENTGTKTQPKLVSAKPLRDGQGNVIRITAAEAGGTIQGPSEKWWGYTSCAAADVDEDGDLDLIVNDSLGRLRWIENVGTRTKPILSGDIRSFLYKDNPLIIPWRNRPAVADWNADGVEEVTVLDDCGRLVAYPFNKSDPDRLVDRRDFKDHEGRGVAVNATPITRPNSGRAQLDAADWDGDGDIDLMAGRPRTAGDGNLLYYENIGTPQDPVFLRSSMKARNGRFAEWSSGDGHDQWHSTGPCMTDWNGDGKQDLIFGVEMGQLAFYDHDYFEGDEYPLFKAESFQTLETDAVRTVFRFQGLENDEFSQSLNPLSYPPQLLLEDSGLLNDPRTVRIISPAADAVLSGLVVFEAGVAGGRTLKKAEFFVDGEFLAVEGQAPYIAFGDDSTWDTRQVKDGSHVLSVKAIFSDGEVLTIDQTHTVKNQ